MGDLVGEPSVEDAWLAFTVGDVTRCADELSACLQVLTAQLAAASVRLGDAWQPETATAAHEAFRLGLLAYKAGALACAARAQRAVLLATWSAAEASSAARWLQTAAAGELALVELGRNRGTVGLARLRALRQQLIDEELRELLTESEDVEQPAIERLDDRLEYLERVLRLSDSERVRPSYEAEETPPTEPAAPPSDRGARAPVAARAAWPEPLGTVEHQPGFTAGLDQLSDLNDETWRSIYEGREAARDERHEASLEAFNRAIQGAERMAAAFLGSWEARRDLAVAIAGRSNALVELELGERSLEDLALARGILADLSAAFPEVIELRTDEAWAASTESWRLCKLGRADDEVLERGRDAVELLERARNTAAREPDDILAAIWILRHNDVHLRTRHAFFEIARDSLRCGRLYTELETNYRPQAHAFWVEVLEQAHGVPGAVVRALVTLLERRRTLPSGGAATP